MRRTISTLLMACFLIMLIIPIGVSYAANSSDRQVVLHSTSIDVSRATVGDTITLTIKADNVKYDDTKTLAVMELDPFINTQGTTQMCPLKEVEDNVYQAKFKVTNSWKNGDYRLSVLDLVPTAGGEAEHFFSGESGMTSKAVTIYGCTNEHQAAVIKSISGRNQTVYDGDTFSYDLEIEDENTVYGTFSIGRLDGDNVSSIHHVLIQHESGTKYSATFTIDSSWTRGEYVVYAFNIVNAYMSQTAGWRNISGFPAGYTETKVIIDDKKQDDPTTSESVKPSESPKPSESVIPSELPKPSENPEPSESPKPTEPVSTTYSDVPVSGTWYSNAVYYATGKGYMAGTGNNKFSPTGTVTRGTIAQILYAAEGKPSVSGKSQFTDVGNAKWYADAVKWAADKGLVSGYGNGKFGPENAVTREQMLAIMYKYSEMKGYNLTASADLSKFADQKDISKYAVNAMKWGVAHKVISGTDKGIEPKGNATRAQIAVILQAYDNNVRK